MLFSNSSSEDIITGSGQLSGDEDGESRCAFLVKLLNVNFFVVTFFAYVKVELPSSLSVSEIGDVSSLKILELHSCFFSGVLGTNTLGCLDP